MEKNFFHHQLVRLFPTKKNGKNFLYGKECEVSRVIAQNPIIRLSVCVGESGGLDVGLTKGIE